VAAELRRTIEAAGLAAASWRRRGKASGGDGISYRMSRTEWTSKAVQYTGAFQVVVGRTVEEKCGLPSVGAQRSHSTQRDAPSYANWRWTRSSDRVEIWTQEPRAADPPSCSHLCCTMDSE